MPRSTSTCVPDRSEVRRKATLAPRTATRKFPRAPANQFAAECLPYSAELNRFALRLSRNPDDARDLVQETLMRAMIAWERFETGSNVRAWLHRILANTFINGYRKTRRHQQFTVRLPADTRRAIYGSGDDCVPDCSSVIIEQLLSDEVARALSRLDAESSDVVARADLAGETYKDIAAALQLPIGTVMSRLFRARRQLEGQLDQYAAREWGLGAGR